MIPIVRASSTSCSLPPKSISPRPSEPMAMPSEEEQHQAGYAQPAREQRRPDPQRQQAAGDEDEGSVLHWRAA